MPLLGSKNKKKAAVTPRASLSATTASSSNKGNSSPTIYPHQSALLSRLPSNASTPTVYQQQQYNTNFTNHTSPSLSAQQQQQQQHQSYQSSLISPFDSPTPTPSTSWTSEMSAFVDKLRDDAAAIVGSTKYQSQQHQLQCPPLDRKSVSQGMKLVAIAADEYEDGNDDVALDIYLSGIDKILMALPSKSLKHHLCDSHLVADCFGMMIDKTDPRTKLAIREKLQR
jgi:hypothetical protein